LQTFLGNEGEKQMSTPTRAPATSARKKKASGSVLQGGKVWFIMGIIVSLLAATGAFVVLNQVAATTTYYVLNQDVPARTQIVPEMLTPVVTSLGGEPRNVLGVDYVQSTPTYSKFALNAGDTLSLSNAGELIAITAGVPEDFVVASFSAPPENAVAGRVKRGDYIDIVTASANEAAGDEVAKFILRNVLVLDVNSDLVGAEADASVDEGTGDEAAAADSAAARSGIPSLYTVAVSPQDATKLALITTDTIFVVLSPSKNIENGAGEEMIKTGKIDLYDDNPVGDSGIGTDPTFGAGGAETEEGAAPVDGTETTDGTTQEAPSEEPAPVEEEPVITE
jgi:Flp pilus assembly protein RcpC/CpaB